jgi:hypothetical protein
MIWTRLQLHWATAFEPRQLPGNPHWTYDLRSPTPLQLSTSPMSASSAVALGVKALGSPIVRGVKLNATPWLHGYCLGVQAHE